MYDYDEVSDTEINLSSIEYVPHSPKEKTRDTARSKIIDHPSKRSDYTEQKNVPLGSHFSFPKGLKVDPKKGKVANDRFTNVIDKQLTIVKNEPNKQSKDLQVLSEEDVVNKRRLLLMIDFYLLEFPEKLKPFKKIKFENKSIEELEKIKKEMDFTISNSSTVQAGTQMVTGTIQTIEVLSIYCGINCQGLSNRLCNDPQTIDDIKHMCLKHMHLVSAEPEARLLYKILTNMVLLHNINPSTEQVENAKDELNDINMKYKDI